MRYFVDIDKFTMWLMQFGCEILPPTNEYEALRFKGKETGVLYTSGKTSNNYTSEAVEHYERGSKNWTGGPVKTGRYNSYKRQKRQLIERDGLNCFYCDKPLGEDITVEHLVALSCGGPNTLANMVLAHEKCNWQMSNKPVSEKVKSAISIRIYNQIK